MDRRGSPRSRVTGARGRRADRPQGPALGDRIREWRLHRGLSQSRLAQGAGISPRHMSFVETGRSRPSREVLIRIAGELGLPLREENALMESAGYARRYRESNLAEPALDQVRRVLRFLLDRHEPHPALVIDGNWEIVLANDAHRRTASFFAPDDELPSEVSGNLLRLAFHPNGLRQSIVNWHVVGPAILARAEAEYRERPSAGRLGLLIEEVRSYAPVPPRVTHGGQPPDLLLPVHLRRGRVDVRLLSVLSSLVAPTDVTLQELRIETFFPTDAESEEQLRAVELSGRSPA